MAYTPEVTVGVPDDLGWRTVTISGKSVGKVRSPSELQKLLSHAGQPFGRDVRWIGGDSTVWPDRAVRRRAVGGIMFIGFFLSACLLIWIGWKDSCDALTFGGRLAGYTVLAAGLMVLIAALSAVDYWHKRERRYSGAIVLAGVGIVFLGSFSLLLLQIGEQLNRRSVIVILFLVGSVVAGIELIRSRAWKGLRYPGRIAIGAIIPTLLAGMNLAYTQVYVPYTVTPLIMSGAEFKEASLDRARAAMHVTVRLHVRNDGKIPVYVLGSIYWIHGGPANLISEDGPPSLKLIYDGEFVTPEGRVLDPGEEIAQDVVVEIENPEKLNYEAIRAQTQVYVIRKDRMILPANYGGSRVTVEELKKRGEKLGPREPKGTEYKNESGISNSSEILNVIRGPQRITVWRVSGRERSRIDVAISPPGDRVRFNPNLPKRSQEMIDRYGFAQVRGSTAQTPFKELLEKAGSTEAGASKDQSGQ
ncbi:hypothetical protein [Streptomyces sp. NBC_01408]|uniref:hypothetical protein n=1 Tax=Streptomyces sp. NBC_01408 TaxID=2903855 RepID=UPI00225C2D8E|nr:hypothetical protein [Streptomyces sp. NBC_01408]MCX4691850.1 hypothetical protein [Streptomyces sp. NBC_01408]